MVFWEKKLKMLCSHTKRSTINMSFLSLLTTTQTNKIVLFFSNVTSFLLPLTLAIVRATYERHTKMSQIRPILGHIDLSQVVPKISRCAQGPMLCFRTDEDKPIERLDEQGYHLHRHIVLFPWSGDLRTMPFAIFELTGGVQLPCSRPVGHR